MNEEKAPPFESWEEHLKALRERDLVQLAKDYLWLDVEARAQEERREFRARLSAVIAELERRGMSDAAAGYRQSAAKAMGR